MARSRLIREDALQENYQARSDPGLESFIFRRVNDYAINRLTYSNLCCFRILILLENPDRGMLSKDRILRDKDFLDLLLRRRIVHHV